MKKLFLLSAICLLLPTVTQAQSSDDFGVWTEIGASKDFGKHFSVGLDGEIRSKDTSKSVDRMNIGINGGYKLNKYVKFGLAYLFMGYYSAEKRTDKFDSEDGEYKGYNIDDSHWTLKHRVNVEVTGSYKPTNWLKMSLRERYQFTHAQESEWTETKYRKGYDPETAEPGYFPRDPETEISPADNAHILRSRLKFEIDKKKLKWSPYTYVELFNSLEDKMYIEKVRFSLGTSYKITKHHSVSLGYILNFKRSKAGDLNDRLHALNIGYNFKF